MSLAVVMERVLVRGTDGTKAEEADGLFILKDSCKIDSRRSLKIKIKKGAVCSD